MRRIKRDEIVVAPNTTLLTEGYASNNLYTALAGFGLRHKTVSTNRRQVVGFTFPGDLIGLQGGHMGRMGHSFLTTTQMTLCVFNRADLVGLYAEQPERGFDLTWLAASEENFLGEMLASIGQRSAMQAMAWLMLRTILRCRALGLTLPLGQDGASMPFPYRQQDIADSLGLSLVHTNKTLAKLRARDLAAWTEGQLRVPDLVALGEAAGTDIATASPMPRPLV